MGAPHLLVHDHRDNVWVVVVEDLAAGTEDLLCLSSIEPGIRIPVRIGGCIRPRVRSRPRLSLATRQESGTGLDLCGTCRRGRGGSRWDGSAAPAPP